MSSLVSKLVLIINVYNIAFISHTNFDGKTILYPLNSKVHLSIYHLYSLMKIIM